MITAAKNPTQIEDVAAKGPCLDEKNVPTSPGNAEPVKIPVIFCVDNTVSISRLVSKEHSVRQNSHI